MSGKTGAIASPHRLATEAGVHAYRSGGNALDAALAAAAVLCVVYPHNTSIGGDLVALVRTPGGGTVCVNATGPAPAARDLAALRALHGDRLPPKGPDTITVPGAVRGWEVLHGYGAAREWPAHFAAAIRHAAGGEPVSRSLAAALPQVGEQLLADAGARAVLAPGGALLRAGDPLCQPRLAASLRSIADDGPGALYGGPVGTALVEGLRAAGCPMGEDDLAAYTAETTDALSAPFAGFHVHTSPPNTQGFALLRTLRALTALGLDAPSSGIPAGVLARLFADGARVRDTLLADPRTAATDVEYAGFEDTVAALRAGGPYPAGRAVAAPYVPGGDTVGIAAADEDGFAVSLIQSLYGNFGSAVLEPRTGILMQNRGTAFSLDPAAPHAIRPGARPPHTLMPVLVTRDGRLRWVNATMGGQAQPQIHAQVLLRLVRGASPQEAVEAPRWVVGAREPGDGEDTVHHEEDVAAQVVAALAADGFPLRAVPARTEFLGHTNVVAVGPDGALTAGSDPRSDGTAVVTALPRR